MIFVQYKYFKDRKMGWRRDVRTDETTRFLVQECNRARSWLWRWYIKKGGYADEIFCIPSLFLECISAAVPP